MRSIWQSGHLTIPPFSKIVAGLFKSCNVHISCNSFHIQNLLIYVLRKHNEWELTSLHRKEFWRFTALLIHPEWSNHYSESVSLTPGSRLLVQESVLYVSFCSITHEFYKFHTDVVTKKVQKHICFLTIWHVHMVSLQFQQKHYCECSDRMHLMLVWQWICSWLLEPLVSCEHSPVYRKLIISFSPTS